MCFMCSHVFNNTFFKTKFVVVEFVCWQSFRERSNQRLLFATQRTAKNTPIFESVFNTEAENVQILTQNVYFNRSMTPYFNQKT